MRFLLVLVLVLFASADAFACSCIGVADRVGAVAKQEAVFRGTVVATEVVLVAEDGSTFATTPVKGRRGSIRRVTVFKVLERFKGEVAPLTIVLTGGGGGDCGYTFETGKTYVVYANAVTHATSAKLVAAPRALVTGLCSATGEERAFADDLPKIRRAYKPATAVFLDQSR